MGLWGQQFIALLWKGLILKKRHYVSTAFEFVLPLLASLLIAYLYSKFELDSLAGKGGELNNATIYKGEEWNDKFWWLGNDILYAPQNEFTDQIVNEMKLVLQTKKEYGRTKFFNFTDEDALVAEYISHFNESNWGSPRYIGIVFKSKNVLDFKIRLPPSDVANPEQLFPPRVGEYPNGGFYYRKFAEVQTLVSEAYLNVISKEKNVNRTSVSTAGRRFPYPPYKGASIRLLDFLPIFIYMGFIITPPIIVKRLADEKSGRSREMLKMMGLNDWIFWSTSFLNNYLMYIVQALLITFMYYIPTHSVIKYTNPVLFFAFLALYGASFILFAMLISVPFNRPVFGVIVAIFAWILTYVIPALLLNPNVGVNVNVQKTNLARILSCVLPNVGLNLGLGIISVKESFATGVTFSNVFEAIPSFGSLSFGLVIVMQIISILLMSVLIWYLENVWPWQHGVPKPFYYPFTADYWFPKSNPVDVDEDNLNSNRPNFERQLSLQQVSISLRNVQKGFGYGLTKKLAVTDLSMDINHGQITVLLGHNGAGKTTTMNMITGMFPPSSGVITVDGYDVITQTALARQSMSLCPQHNILYEELTVEEHLKLYAGIKGVLFAQIDAEVRKIASQVDLESKLNTQSRSLSGGMKRRLCLGIALVGKTKIVILDEPTSGLDPEARRNLWDLLLSVKREKTILLTTHYMEEADALGDRIAIMADGELKCYGTPMFLKNIFGAGYQLRVAKAPNFNGNDLGRLIQKYFPSSSVLSEVEAELIYSLEKVSSERAEVTKMLPLFFDELERFKDKLGVASCGISVTTIEDVFLGVNRSNELDSKGNGNEIDGHNTFGSRSQNGSRMQLDLESSTDYDRLSGAKLLLQKFRGLFLKRLNFAKRAIPLHFLPMLVPCIIFVFMMFMENSNREPPKRETKELILDLSSLYGNTTDFLVKGEKDFDDVYGKIVKDSKGELISSNEGADMNEFVLERYTQKGVTLRNFIETFMVGAQILNTGEGLKATAWFQGEAYHSGPIALNMMYNALLKNITSEDKYSITVSNQPFPKDEDLQSGGNQSPTYRFFIIILVSMSLPFYACSFVYFTIHERSSKAKLLQFMSGVHPALFWITSYLFDFLLYIICAVTVYIILLAMDTHGIFTYDFEGKSAMFLVIILYGFAAIAFANVTSFVFNKPSSGFTVLVIVVVIFGMILKLLNYLLEALANNELISQTLFSTLSKIFGTLPNYVFVNSFMKMYDHGTNSLLCERTPKEVVEKACNRFDFNFKPCCPMFCNNDCFEPGSLFQFGKIGINMELITLVVDTGLFVLILFLLEVNWARIMNEFSKNKQSTDMPLNDLMDTDVVNETRRVDEMLFGGDLLTDSLIVSRLKKNFKRFPAVKGLDFGVHRQECFGFLGVNGAGKTTTFRMLVGDLTPTSGNAYCEAYNIRDSLDRFQQQIGYCPQFDALLSKLSGRETLYLFGRLRGIREDALQRRVEELIAMVDLKKHCDKKTEDYSGGNKRKLSLAIALIGSPSLLFLDEPSAGVDPEARRKIWKTLAFVREAYGCSIVLTSHSMDECEALCSRIAIMVNGEFKCIGSIQHLRSKYGQGFTISAKIKRENLTEANVNLLMQNVQSRIPSAVVKDVNETVVTYHVTDPSTKLGYLFKVMSDIKEELNLEDYAVSDTTLEQIFIAFARHQTGVDSSG